jgi:hypothetical protein
MHQQESDETRWQRFCHGYLGHDLDPEERPPSEGRGIPGSSTGYLVPTTCKLLNYHGCHD